MMEVGLRTWRLNQAIQWRAIRVGGGSLCLTMWCTTMIAESLEWIVGAEKMGDSTKKRDKCKRHYKRGTKSIGNRLGLKGRRDWQDSIWGFELVWLRVMKTLTEIRKSRQRATQVKRGRGGVRSVLDMPILVLRIPGVLARDRSANGPAICGHRCRGKVKCCNRRGRGWTKCETSGLNFPSPKFLRLSLARNHFNHVYWWLLRGWGVNYCCAPLPSSSLIF